eukprot:7482033-Karenia_brevis.AAC.1
MKYSNVRNVSAVASSPPTVSEKATGRLWQADRFWPNLNLEPKWLEPNLLEPTWLRWAILGPRWPADLPKGASRIQFVLIL